MSCITAKTSIGTRTCSCYKNYYNKSACVSLGGIKLTGKWWNIIVVAMK